VNIFSDKNEANRNLLQGQVKTKSGEEVTHDNVKEFTENEVLPEVKIAARSIKSNDGVERVKAKVVIKMVPEHLAVRAKQYLSQVKINCMKYNESIPLVMAVMETESYFNPLAKSHIPAYGLLQIVPKYAGRDAYKYVHKEDKQPKPSYLYVPNNNINLGIAYMNLLRTRYFYGIKDPVKQEYMVIAAYNGGMGNVIRRVIKKYKVHEMSPPMVYEALRKEMPDETKDYLAKVTRRKNNYLAWE
ncbi:transglycosylase SLT domain-containing protein, partial [Candidatus Poribacteria bacterium]|nr:transglycosylase SLT domain-containing protein [Candidatus Poribacteria bacterium]